MSAMEETRSRTLSCRRRMRRRNDEARSARASRSAKDGAMRADVSAVELDEAVLVDSLADAIAPAIAGDAVIQRRVAHPRPQLATISSPTMRCPRAVRAGPTQSCGPGQGQGAQQAGTPPRPAHTWPAAQSASAPQPVCTHRPPFTHTRAGGRASRCSRHWPTGPQLPHGSPSVAHTADRRGVVVDVVPIAGTCWAPVPAAQPSQSPTSRTSTRTAPV